MKRLLWLPQANLALTPCISLPILLRRLLLLALLPPADIPHKHLYPRIPFRIALSAQDMPLPALSAPFSLNNEESMPELVLVVCAAA